MQSVEILIFDLAAALILVKVKTNVLNSHRERLSAYVVPFAYRTCLLCFRKSNSAFFRENMNVRGVFYYKTKVL